MTIEIIDYGPEYAVYFEMINKAWLEEYFTIEPIDKYVLENPKGAILDQGGEILFAKMEDRVVGTAALRLVDSGIYELTKMGVENDVRGRGVGKILCTAAIEKARDKGAKKIVLYSNRILANAIHIYLKMGFLEVPLDAVYKRSDIKMELSLVR